MDRNGFGQATCHGVERVEVLPDFVSVNFNEPGRWRWRDCDLRAAWGSRRGLVAFWRWKILWGVVGEQCLRALVEPEEQEMARRWWSCGLIEAFLNRGGVNIPR